MKWKPTQVFELILLLAFVILIYASAIVKAETPDASSADPQEKTAGI